MNSIRIDQCNYTHEEGNVLQHSILKSFEDMGFSKNKLKGFLFALVVKDTFQLLNLIEILKEHGASFLLIHSETPRERCLELAEYGKCHYLFYDDKIITLEGEGFYNEVSLMQFSSGTTGKPKTIVRTWENILLEINNYNALLNSQADEVPVILVPASHSFGLIAGILSAFNRGVVPHVVTNMNPKFYMKIISSYNKPLVYGVPFQFHLMHSMNKDFVFYKLMSSGAPLNEKLFNDFKKKGSGVMQQYGCTECGCISIAHEPESITDNGKNLAHIIVQVSSDKQNPSEIILKADNKEILTNDLGYLSQNGSLHVLNRLDDLINISGQKVTPFEVEEIISRMEGVKETVVYRSRHTIWGDCVAAIIVSDKKWEPAEIKKFCCSYLPAYKVPSKINFVNEIPRTERGKISRNLLRAMEEKNE